MLKPNELAAELLASRVHALSLVAVSCGQLSGITVGDHQHKRCSRYPNRKGEDDIADTMSVGGTRGRRLCQDDEVQALGSRSRWFPTIVGERRPR